MESGLMEAAAAARVSGTVAHSRVPCRNFSRGACRWGQNCRFSHDRKSSQICRHFQNGFCCYGDRCSYQHVPPIPVATLGSRRSSEPAVYMPPSVLYSGMGSDFSFSERLPLLPASNLDRARRGSEPTLPSVTELRGNFEQLHTEIEEGEESTDEGTANGGPLSANWALAAEFIPRHTPAQGSRSREHGLQRSLSDPIMSENEASVATLSSLHGGTSSNPTAYSKEPKPEPKVAGGRDVAAALEQSKEVVCGICMDKVYEKALPHERLFGILPKCNHSFCVACIRKWRKSRDFQTEVIKGCPQCRIKSSYFIPHKYWISDAAEKEKLVQTFTGRTSKIRCKFFVRGHGHCPFKSDCIYLHELPPGHQHKRRREQRRASAALPYRRFVGLLDDDDDDDDDDDFDFEEDFYLLQCAVALAILERSSGLDYSQEIEIMLGSSDSD